MPFVEVVGCRLFYSLEGEPDRPVVVLSNSLGADTTMWDGQMPALLQSFRVLRYDTRGHGQSSVPATGCDLTELGRDLVRMMDHASVEVASLCGVSLGGLTAMAAALHAPERFRAVVLSNTAARIGTVDGWNERIAVVKQKGLASIADAVPLRWFTSAFQADGPAMARQKAMLLRCSDAGYIGASAAVRDADLRARIAAIQLPVLVIAGVEDTATTPAEGRALAAAIPGAGFAEIPGAHLCNIEFPAAYNDVLLPFLEQHENHASRP